MTPSVLEDAWRANKVIHTVGAPGRAISSALPPECRLIRYEPRFQAHSPPSLRYSRRWLLVFAQPSAWLSTRTAPPRRWEIPDLLSFDFSLFSLRRWVSFELLSSSTGRVQGWAQAFANVERPCCQIRSDSSFFFFFIGGTREILMNGSRIEFIIVSNMRGLWSHGRVSLGVAFFFYRRD